MIRQKIRDKYGIEGSLINDIMCHCCCPAVQSSRKQGRFKLGMLHREWQWPENEWEVNVKQPIVGTLWDFLSTFIKCKNSYVKIDTSSVENCINRDGRDG